MSEELRCSCELCVKDHPRNQVVPEALECRVQFEGQLEELLVKNFESIFKDAMSKVVNVSGQSAAEATQFFQKDGCFYGVKDALSRIVQKTLLLLARSNPSLCAAGGQVMDFKDLERSVLEEIISAIKEACPILRKNGTSYHSAAFNACSAQNCSHLVNSRQSQFVSSSLVPSGQGEYNHLAPIVSLQNSARNLAPLTAECASSSEDSSLRSSPGPIPECGLLISSCSFVDGSFSGSRLSNSRSGAGGPDMAMRGEAMDSLPKHGNFPALTFAAGTTELPASQFSNYKEQALGLSVGPPHESCFPSTIPDKNFCCTLASGMKGQTSESLSGRSAMVQIGMTTLQGSLPSEATFLSLTSGSVQGNIQESQHQTPRLSSSQNTLGADSFRQHLVQSSAENCSFSMCSKNSHRQSSRSLSEGSLIAAGRELSLTLGRRTDSSKQQSPGQVVNEYNEVEDSLGSNILNHINGFSESLNQNGSLLEELQLRIRELEVEVQGQTQWAQEKVLQAASKLSKDYSELRALRLEREEACRLKKEIQILEDNFKKKISELESALRKTISQAEFRSATVRRLELENADMRAEVEAAKLNASESEASNQVIAKREKKALKKERTWERQRGKLQEELARERQRICDLQTQLVKVKDQKHQAEVRLGQEVKAREMFTDLLESERKAKEQIEATAKRKEDSLKQKAETNELKHQDDVRRLEHEIQHLSTAKFSPLPHVPTDTDSRILPLFDALVLEDSANIESPKRDDIQRERDCLMCMLQDKSVLFLPCAHQIICVKCNELHEKKGMKDCPSCRTPIEQRIKVYGVNI